MKQIVTSYHRAHRLCGLLLTLWLAGAGNAVRAADTGSEMVNLMRGMFTGLSLLGQAANTPGWNAQGYPGPQGWTQGGSPWSGVSPGISPWGTPMWGSPTWGAPPWPPAPPMASAWPPGTPAIANPQWSATNGRNASLTRMLQGSWETHTGGLLLIKGNLARLYVSRDRYQDLEIRVDRHYLWMKPAGSSQPHDRYEHRIFDRRVILRDPNGEVLLLRRHVADQ